MRNIRPIRTPDDHRWALAEVAPYFEAEPAPGTPESDRFCVLLDLIWAYEEKQAPIEAPDAVDMIAAVMDLRGYTQKDLADLLGSRSRASEILARKRALTMAQAHRIHREWGVPAESLLAPYHVEAA